MDLKQSIWRSPFHKIADYCPGLFGGGSVGTCVETLRNFRKCVEIPYFHKKTTFYCIFINKFLQNFQKNADFQKTFPKTTNLQLFQFFLTETPVEGYISLHSIPSIAKKTAYDPPPRKNSSSDPLTRQNRFYLLIRILSTNLL